jgi:hypothetical protein
MMNQKGLLTIRLLKNLGIFIIIVLTVFTISLIASRFPDKKPTPSPKKPAVVTKKIGSLPCNIRNGHSLNYDQAVFTCHLLVKGWIYKSKEGNNAIKKEDLEIKGSHPGKCFLASIYISREGREPLKHVGKGKTSMDALSDAFIQTIHDPEIDLKFTKPNGAP